jgi:hypothetical protein
MKRNKYSASQKHTHQFFDFCDVQVQKVRKDYDPFELEVALSIGFQNGVAVAHEEHWMMMMSFICSCRNKI